MLKAGSFQETTTRLVTLISNAKHLPDPGGSKQQVHRLSHRGRSNAAPLRFELKGITDLSSLPISGEKNANVTNETIGDRLRNPELHPIAQGEHRRRVHPREKGQRFRL